ncbi:MAG: hypothetical protein V7K67_32760 [Nostoc sp.]|uniref:hypothetical protein n=1 Tax=Nostoc sp. TaxID=1180 RepID=UPI002FF2193F
MHRTSYCRNLNLYRPEAAVRGRVAGIDLTVSNQGSATYTGTFATDSLFAPFIIVDGRPQYAWVKAKTLCQIQFF